jgi:hydroxymethylglutaryl-CoA reductase
MNILNQLGANDQEKTVIANYFDDKTVTHNAVVDKFQEVRNTK